VIDAGSIFRPFILLLEASPLPIFNLPMQQMSPSGLLKVANVQLEPVSYWSAVTRAENSVSGLIAKLTKVIKSMHHPRKV
jgi:hypothetical protein